MLVKLKLPVNKKILINVKPNATSYETIWAADRIPPKKAYFELLDHPDIIKEYTPKVETPKNNKTPKLIFDKTPPILKGIIAQQIKLTIKVIIGANIKIK